MRARVRTLLLTLSAAAAFGARGDAASPQTPVSPPAQAPGPAATPAASPAPVRELDDFVPSEKVKADEAVSFPTDI
jgi:hypothetical protein